MKRIYCYAINGLLAGTLGASITVAIMDYDIGLDVAFRSFFTAFSHGIFLAGIPGLVVSVLVSSITNHFSKKYKASIISGVLASLVIGLIIGPIVYISYGMF